MDLDIVYQDKFMLVVNKPSGLLSVPGKAAENFDSIAYRVTQMFPGCKPQPCVHRLDMATSGLLILAFDKKSHSNLSVQSIHQSQENK